MTVVFVFLGLTVGAGLVVLALGRFEPAPAAVPDRPVAELPDEPLQGANIDALRFGLGLRGYRMDEVDGVLDRVSAELSARDEHLRLLEATLTEHGLPVPKVAPAGQTRVEDSAGPESPRNDQEPAATAGEAAATATEPDR